MRRDASGYITAQIAKIIGIHPNLYAGLGLVSPAKW